MLLKLRKESELHVAKCLILSCVFINILASLGRAEDFNARINLEIDSPSSVTNVTSVLLRGSAGTARLHAPRSEQNTT